MRRLLCTLPLLLASLACIEEAPLAHKGEPRRAATPAEAAQSSQASQAPVQPAQPQVPPVNQAGQQAVLPEGAKPAGAIFGNAVQIVAYKVEPASATPGQPVKVTLWMRALGPIPDDYMVFVHVDDAEGRPERANADHWPAGHRTPMQQWQKGQVVQDEFTFTLGGFGESRAATIWLGLWAPDRDERLPISNPNQVKNDGSNRYALADVPVLH